MLTRIDGPMTFIGIIGSRRRNSSDDYNRVKRAFNRVIDGADDQAFARGSVIVSGGCEKGADSMAENIAKEKGFSILIHYPRIADLDPALRAKNARAAYAVINYARNAFIARDSDVLIAAVAEDRKSGTEDTIKRFIRKHPGATEEFLVKNGRLILV